MTEPVALSPRVRTFGGETWEEQRQRLDAEWEPLLDEKHRKVHGWAHIEEVPAHMLGRELRDGFSRMTLPAKAFGVQLVATRDGMGFGAIARTTWYASREAALTAARKALAQQGKRYAKKYGPPASPSVDPTPAGSASAAVTASLAIDDGKARNGVWTPWALVLCVDCDHAALKDSPRAAAYPDHLAAVAVMDRTAEVERPEGQLRGMCNTCHRACWVREDVALLQQVGFATADLDWDGTFGWALEQTGGMCAALVISTETREIVVSAMDGDFFVGEYKRVGEDEERWMDPLRTWQSESLYRDGALKATGDLGALVEQCARKVIAFVCAPAEVAS